MRPVKSNLQSRKCDNPIGTDCIIVSTVCGVNTLTEKLAQIDEAISCCTGDFPPGHVSCYTGLWVDVSAAVPLSGLASGIMPFTITGPSLQYRWTPDGDLLLRGFFTNISFTPTATNVQTGITLATVSVNCLPTNAISKWVTLGGRGIITNNILNDIDFYLQFDITTGALILVILYVGQSLAPVSFGIAGVEYGLSLDTRLNLA